ncbi:MAG: SBBP repeat-containing protein [Ignavibacteria bacterium]|nr:SBBP repeat-containing protein [Ignavibacteria bacterium]
MTFRKIAILFTGCAFISSLFNAGADPYSRQELESRTADVSDGRIEAEAPSLSAADDSRVRDMDWLRRDVFVENLGQVRGSDGHPRADVLFTASAGDARLFITARGISVVLVELLRDDARTSEATGLRIGRPLASPPRPALALKRLTRIDLEFAGADPAAVPEASGRVDGLSTFTSARAPHGIAGVRSFRDLTWRNLWPGIDAEFRMQDGGLKYAFRVRPGASPSDIKIRYSGPAAVGRDADGRVLVSTPAGLLTDDAPLSFAGVNPSPSEGVSVPTRFAVNGDTVGFDVEPYDRAATLLIDPFLNWSTYYGGSSSDYARDVRCDAEGNTYVAGYTMSVDFPVSQGAFQPENGGNLDIFVVKLDAERKRVWGTYYGGSDEEEAPHMALDKTGGVILAGYTSSTDFPVTPGAFQTVNNGKYDVFLLKLDVNGSRLWATYAGGGLSDECGGVVVDREGGVVIAGGTYSTNFPVSKSASQTTNKGDFDVFAAKFTPAGTRVWSSYFGGFGLDYANSVSVNAEGQIIIAGYTESANFPVTKDGAQPVYGGGQFDMFVLKLNPGGVPVWGTYFGGSKEDRALSVTSDPSGRVIVSGYTESQNFPATLNAFQKKLGGGLDGAILELNGKGAVVWASFLGGKALDIINDNVVDGAGNILVTGHTESGNFPVTANAFQKRSGGAYDAFLVRLNSAGSRMFATYRGGKDQDIGYGLAVETRGNVIMTGITSSTDFPISKNALQRKRAGFTDGFLVRMIFDEPTANAGRDTAVCFGASATLGLPPANGKPPYSYAWRPATALSATDVLHPVAAPRKTTIYELTVTDADGATCTDSVTVAIRPLPRASAGRNVSVCPGSGVEIGGMASGGLSPYWYSWTPAQGLSATDVPTPTASPSATTTYVVTVRDKAGCENTDSVTVTVHPRILVDAGDDQTMCAKAEVQLGRKTSGGNPPYTYAWSPREGLSSVSAAQPIARPEATTTYTLTVTDAKGCRESDSVVVRVLPLLALDAGTDPVICSGQTVRIGGIASNGRAPYAYSWSPAEGLSSAALPQPLASPRQTTAYILTAVDATGCTGVDTVLVRVNPTVIAHAGPDVNMCEGSATPIGETATGGTPPYTYLWTPAKGLSSTVVASPVANPSATTRYIVTVSDAAGCAGLDTITVVVNPMPRIKADNDFSLCKGSRRRLTATVRGGRAPVRYEWEPRQGLSAPNIANPFANPDATTRYIVTAVDANGCRVSDTIVITVRPCSKADAGPDLDMCTGAELTLGGEAADPAEEPTYTWTPATGLTNPKLLRTGASPTSTTTYALLVTNMYGCETTDTVTVVVHPSPMAGAGPPVTLCEGGSTTIGTEASGGLPPYSYRWEPADGLSAADVARPVAQPATTTTYRLLVTDAKGCSAKDEVRVTVHPVPVASAGASATVCSGTIVPIGAPSSGGRGPFAYDWSPSEGLDRKNIATPRARPGVTTTYRLTVTNAEGCQSVDSVTITVNASPQPVITAGGPTTFCEGAPMRLDAGEGYASYQWSNGGTARTIDVTKSGSYSVTVFDEHGCKGVAPAIPVTVLPSPRPRIIARGPVRFCEGDDVALDAGAGFARYQWSTGAATRMITVTQSGAYAATVSNGAGCSTTTDTVTVVVSPRPVARIERRADTLIAADAPSHQWLLNRKPLRGAVQRALVVTRPGAYAVLARGDGGCVATSDAVQVDIGSSVVALGSISAQTRDTVGIPLTLLSERGLAQSGATDYEAVVRIKKKDLLLLDTSLTATDDGDAMRITVRGSRTPGARELATIRVQAVAPKAVRTPVVLEAFRWLNGLAAAKTKNGAVRIVRVR